MQRSLVSLLRGACFLLPAILATFTVCEVRAQVGQTWTAGGAADGAWSNTANWGGTLPTQGAATSITFNGTAGTTVLNQDLGTPFVLNTLAFNRTSSTALFTIAGGGLQFDGPNAAILFQGTGASTVITNTIASNVTIAGGALSLISTGTNNNVLRIMGTISSVNASPTTLTLDGTSTGSNTIVGNISDGAGIVGISKTGTGLWNLQGNNNFTGNVTIQQGTLRFLTPANLGAGEIVMGNAANSAGVLSFSGSAPTALSQKIWLSGTAGQAISADAGLTTATLAVTSTIDALDANAKTLILGGVNLGANDFQTLLTDATLTAIGLQKSGAGTWVVSNAGNSFTGGVTINAGQLRVTDAVSQLNLDATGNNLRFNAAVGTVAVLETAGSLTLGIGAGAGQIQWNGNGASGGFSALGGALDLTLNNDAATPLVWNTLTTASGFVTRTGELQFNSTLADNVVTLHNAINLTGTSRIIRVTDNPNTANDYAVLSGTLSNGGIVKTGNGVLVLSAKNDFNSHVTLAGGVLRTPVFADNLNGANLRFTVTAGTLAVIESNGTITAGIGAGANQIQFANTAAAAGGAGGFSAYGGDLTVRLNNDAVTPLLWNTATTNGGFVTAAGELQFNWQWSDSAVTLENAIDFNGAARTIRVTDNTNTLNDYAVMSGALTNGGLIKQGTGTLVLNGDSTYAGGTTLAGGTLVIGNTTALGTGAVTTLTGTVLVADDAYVLPNNVILSGVMTFTGLNGVTFDGSGVNQVIAATTLSNRFNSLAFEDEFQLGNNMTLVNIGSVAFDGGLTGTGLAALTLTLSSTGAVTASGINLSGDAAVHSLSLRFTNAAMPAMVVNGVVADGGTGSSLFKAGTPDLVLTQNNTYSGMTTVGSGNLRIGNGGTTGNLAGNITVTGQVIFDRSDAMSYTGLISGTGTVALASAVDLLFTQNHTYTGATSLNPGTTLRLGNGGTGGAVIGAITNNGTVIVNRSDVLTYTNVISGSGSLVINSTSVVAGGLQLNGVNTFTGPTTVTRGTLRYGIATALPAAAAAIALNNTGTLDLNGFSASILSLSDSLGGGGIVTNNGATDVTFTVQQGAFSGVIRNGVTNAVGLSKAGAGTLILSGNNTFTGTSTLSAGTIVVQSDSALGGAAALWNVTGGTLGIDTAPHSLANAINLLGILTVTGDQALTLNGTLTNNGANRTINALNTAGLTLGGTVNLAEGATGRALVVSGSGAVTIAGLIQNGGTATSGTLAITNTSLAGVTLLSNNTFVGPTTLGAASILNLGNGGSTGMVTGTISIGTGGKVVFNRDSIVGYGSGAGILTGAGAVEVNSTSVTPGGLQLNAVNNYTGTTTITRGTLRLGIANALPATAVLALNTGGTLDLNGFGVALTTLSDGVDGSGVITNGAGTTDVTLGLQQGFFSGVIKNGATNALGINKSGAGILTLAGNNTFSGLSTLGAGTLVIGSGSALGTGAWNVLTGTLSSDGTPRTVNNDLNLLGNPTFSGPSALTLNGTMTNNGNNRTITVANPAGVQFAGNISLAEDATGRLLLIQGAGPLVVSGVVQNGGTATTGTLRLTTTGGVVFTGENTFTGALSISLATTTVTIGNGGTSGNFAGPIQNAGVLVFNRSNTLTYTNVISGAGTVAVDGPATGKIVFGNVNTYTGLTTIRQGSLLMGVNQAIPATNTLFINSTGTLDLNGFNLALVTVSDGVDGFGGGVVTNNAASGTATLQLNTGYFSGKIQDGLNATLGLVKAGTTTLTLNNANSFSALSTLTAGTIVLMNDAALGTATLRVVAGTLLSDGPDRTLSNDLQVAGSLTLGGPSAWKFNSGSQISVEAASTITITSLGGAQIDGELRLSNNLTLTGTTPLTMNGVLGVATLDSTLTVGIVGGQTFGAVNLAADGSPHTLTLRALTPVALGGTISGAGGSLSLQTASVSINGANTYSGNTTVNVGAGINLFLNNIEAFGTSLVTYSTGTIVSSVSGTMKNNFSLNGNLTFSGIGQTVTVDGPGFNSVLAATTLTNNFDALTFVDDMRLGANLSITVGNTVTFTGGISLTGGNRTLTSFNAGGVVINGGSLSLESTGRVLTLAGLGGGITLNGNIADGAGAGPGSVTTVTGSVSFNGPSTYSGFTTITTATVVIGNDQAFGTSLVTVTTGTIIVNGTRVLTNSLVLGGGVAFNGSGSLTFDDPGVTNVLAASTLTNNLTALAFNGETRLGNNLTVTSGNAVSFDLITQTGANRTLTSLNAGGITINNLNLSVETTGRVLSLAGLGGGITVNGVIADGPGAAAGGITLASGTVFLNGANTYSGTTILGVAGTSLVVGNNQAFGTSLVTLTTGNIVSNGSYVVQNNAILGGAVTFTGTGSLAFNTPGITNVLATSTLTNFMSALTFTGETRLGANLTASVGNLVTFGLISQTGANRTVTSFNAGGIAINDIKLSVETTGRILALSGLGGGIAVNGVISDGIVGAAPGGITVTTGTVSFNGASAYSGTTFLNSTTAFMVVGNNQAFGTSLLTLSTGNLVSNGAYVLQNNSALGGALTFTGTGSLAFDAPGVTTVTAATTLTNNLAALSFTGETRLGANLTATVGNLMTFGLITQTGGNRTLTSFNAGGVVVHNVNLSVESTGRVLSLAGLGGGITIDGIIADGGGAAAGGISVSTGTVAFNGASTYSGTTYLAATTAFMVVGNNKAFGSSLVTLTTGNLVSNGAFTLTNNTILGGALTFNGTGSLAFDAPGVTNVLANSTLTNFMSALSFSGETRLGANLATTVGNAVTFDLITQTGGNRTLTSFNAGGMMINDVNLSIETTGRALTLAGLGGGITVNGVIADGAGAGAGSIVSVTGTSTFYGANTYSGLTSLLTGGTIYMGHNGAFGTSTINSTLGTIAGTGGARTLTNNMNLLGAFTLGQSDGNFTFAGSITLSGANGTMTVNNANHTTTFNQIVLSNVVNIRALTVSLTDNSEVVFEQISLGSSTAGSFITLIGGTATARLKGTQAFTGSSTIGGSVTTVLEGGDDRLATLGTLNVVNSAVLSLSGVNQTLNALNTSAGTVVTNSGATAAVLSLTSGNVQGVIADGSGGISLNKLPVGTLTLGGDNTFTGPINVNGGVLAIGSGTSAGSVQASTITLTTASGITWNRTGNVVYNGDILGTGTITLTGGVGTGANFTFRGDITSTGAVVIGGTSTMVTLTNGGTFGNAASITINNTDTLFVDSSVTMGTGLITVSNGGTLVFNGTKTGGNITVSTGGLVDISGSATASQLITGIGSNVTVGGVSTTASVNLSSLLLGGGTLNFDLGAVLNSDAIHLTTTASITAATTFNLNAISGFGASTYTLLNGYTGVLSNLAFLTINGPSGYSKTIINNAGSLQVQFNSLSVRTWDGGTNNIWDVNGTPNFTGSTFSPGEAVEFLSGKANTDITLANGGAPLTPGSVLVNNDVATPYTFRGDPIGGATGLDKQGAGLLVLANDNTFTGGINVSGGTLQIGEGGTTGSITATLPIGLSNGSHLVVDRDGTLSLTGNISGSGDLLKRGTGTLILYGTNTYGGDTTVAEGTLQIRGTGVSLAKFGTITVDSAVFSLSTTAAVATPTLAVTNGGRVNVDLGALSITSLFNLVSGSVNVNSSLSANTLTIANLSIADGEINLINAGATITTLTIGGGALDQAIFNIGAGRTLTLVTNVTTLTDAAPLFIQGQGIVGLGSARTLSINSSVNSTEQMTISATIGAGSSFFKAGLGTLYITGTNLGSALNTLSAGTLMLGSSAALGTNSLSLLGGVLRADAHALTVTNNIQLLGNATIGGTANVTLAGTMTNNGGSRTLTVANTGVTTIQSLYLSEGVSTRTFTLSGGGDVIIGQINAGSSTQGNVVVNGAGLSLTLTGANPYGGHTTIVDGNVYVANIGSLGTTNISATLGLQGNTAVVNPALYTLGNVSLTRSFAVLSNTAVGSSATFGGATTDSSSFMGNITFSPSINLSAVTGGTVTFTNLTAVGTTAGIAKLGGGTVILAGTNSYSGTTSIQSGTLRLGSATALGAGSQLQVNASGTLDLNGNNTTLVTLTDGPDGGGYLLNGGSAATLTIANGLFSGTIAGGSNVNVTKTTAGTLILTGNNTYSGVTSILGGTLQIGNGGSTGAIVGNVANFGDLLFNRTGTLVYNGLVSGTGDLGVTGGLTLVLSGDQTYTGVTTIDVGSTLQLGNGGASGSLLSTTIVNAGTLRFNRSDSFQYNAILTGAGGFEQIGTGTITFVGAQQYTGPTTIGVGSTLQLGNGGATGSLVSQTIVNNGTLAVNRSDNFTFTSNVVGSGGFAHVGTGTITFTGNQQYTGPTTIGSAATLQLGDGGTGGSVAGAIVNTGTLAVNRSDSVTLAGNISGNGNLLQNGSGTLVLGGNSSFTGNISINAGTLQVNGNLGAANLATNGNALQFNPSGTQTVAATIVGGGSIEKLGPGTTELNHSNLFTGVTTIGAGTLSIHENLTGNVYVNGGGLQVNSGSVVSGLYVQTGGSSSVESGGALTNAITVNGGALAIRSGGTASSTPGITIGSGGSLNVNYGGTITGNGVINVAGNLNASGTVGDGQVTINVNAGGKLGGGHYDAVTPANTTTGVIQGSVVVNNGGILSPGSSVGTLTIDGSQTVDNVALRLNQGSVINFEFRNAVGSVPGVDWDLVDLGTSKLVIDANNQNPNNQIKVYVDSWNLANTAHGANTFNDAAPLSSGAETTYDWLFMRVAQSNIDVVDPYIGSIGGRFQVIADADGAGVWGANNPYTQPTSPFGKGTFKVIAGDFGQGYGLYIHYSAIPEPGSMILAGLASLGAGWYGRRRKRKEQNPEAPTDTDPTPAVSPEPTV
jgi:fibronectin-binding autotransporter adhesin